MEFSMSRNWLAIRVWVLVTILVVSLAGGPAFAQGGAAVRVDPSTSSLQVNDTATIAIKAENIANLTAFELHLSFNPSVLEVTGLSNGGFVAADFVAQNVFDNNAGTIDYAVAQMNRAPAQGSGTLLNISFHAKAGGTSTLNTRATPAAPTGLLLSDQNGTSIPASWTPGTINVGTATSATNTSTATPTSTGSIPPTTPPVTNTPTAPATATSTGNIPPTTPVGSTATFTATPTATKTPAITSTSPPTGSTLGIHVVRWGEWLYCIARAYRVSPQAIIDANHLWWPNLIFPYQRLTIPNVPWINMTAGPVCQAQFSTSTPSPTPTVVPTIVTPIATNTHT